MAERVHKRFKLCDLTDEQLEKLFESVENEEISSESSENGDPEIDFIESENAAVAIVGTSHINRQRPRSPLPSIETSGPT